MDEQENSEQVAVQTRLNKADATRLLARADRNDRTLAAEVRRIILAALEQEAESA